MGDRVDDVSDVELAPATAQRLLVGTTVAGRATVVRHQHVPALRPPVRDAGHEGDLPLVGRTAVQPAQQPVGRCVGAVQPGVQRAAIGRGDLDQVGLGERLELPPAQRTDRHDVALPRGVVVDDDLSRRARAGSQRSEPAALPRQLTVHTTGHFGDGSSTDIDHTQPTEATLVAGERNPLPVGRDCERALAHAPRRATVFERFVDQWCVVEPQVEPSVVVAQRDGCAVGHEPQLLDGARRLELVAAVRSKLARWIREESHGMAGTFHASHTTPLPLRRRARVEHEVGGAVVESFTSNRRRVAWPTPRPRRARRRRDIHRQRLPGRPQLSCGPWSVSWRTLPGRHGLQPQVPVDGGVDHRVAVSAPAPASPTEPAARARRRVRGQLANG